MSGGCALKAVSEFRQHFWKTFFFT
jgi:hypothetical protein